MRNRITEEDAPRQLTDEESDEGYVSVDHYYAINALHTLRLVAERELMRLSWLMGCPLIPPTRYQGAVRRMLATALDPVWGDYDEAKAALSPELYAELLRTIAGMPMSDLDWAMRIFALSDAAPRVTP